VLSLFFLYFFKWTGTADNFRVIDGDGKDYYSFLVSAFINHNISKPDPALSMVVETPTGQVNMHTTGVALLLLPFFLVSLLFAKLFGYSVDGLSQPFQIGVSIGALFYCLLGLFFLRKLLLKNNFEDKIIAAIIFFLFAGTSLLFYTLGAPSMSHVYSFCLITCFLYASNLFFLSGEKKYLFIASLILSLIILVRPVNVIIVLFLPFFCNSFKDFFVKIKYVFSSYRQFLPALLMFFSVLSLQCVVWYAQNGKLFQWTYKGNGFYFTDPSPVKMLFGFDSGLFIYSPICFLFLIGVVFIFRQSSFKFYISVFFISFIVYLFSSYWAYNYFDSFGMRPFVDFFSVFAIFGTFLLREIRNHLFKYVLYVSFLICATISMIYSYQAQTGILPMAGMNYEKFKYIFLKTKREYQSCLGGCSDLKPYSLRNANPFFSFTNNFNDVSKYPKGYFEYKGNEWGVECGLDSLGFKTKLLYAKVKFKRQEIQTNSSYNGLLVCSVDSKTNASKSYQAFRMNETPAESCCEWKEYDYSFTVAGDFCPNDHLKIYFWNKEKSFFNVDDFNVEIYKN
jgi:hypothetical protein